MTVTDLLPTQTQRTTPTYPYDSPDGTWTYDYRVGTPTPVTLIYNPTGQEADYVSLRSATRGVASGLALDWCKRSARHVVEAWNLPAAQRPLMLPETVEQARRALVYFAGGALETSTRCVCGGYLAQHDGQLIHMDVCADCLIAPDDILAICPAFTVDHVMCHEAEAAQCNHIQCRNRVDLAAEPCLSGKDNCDGCCHGGH